MKRNHFFTIVLMIFLAGCAGKKNLIVLTPDAGGSVGAIQFNNEKGSVVLDEQGKAIVVKDRQSPPSAPTPISETETQSLFREALSARPLTPRSFLLYFMFDSNNLTIESNKQIDEIIQTIKDRDSQDILVIGHTDRAGNPDYNLALSMQRASAVRDLFVIRGVKSEFIQISSHGEGNPLIPTDDNVTEARNRRVEVLVR